MYFLSIWTYFSKKLLTGRYNIPKKILNTPFPFQMPIFFCRSEITRVKILS